MLTWYSRQVWVCLGPRKLFQLHPLLIRPFKRCDSKYWSQHESQLPVPLQVSVWSPQRSGRTDSGEKCHLSASYPRISSAGSQEKGVQSMKHSPGIYQNLAMFSINFYFNFSFPWLFKGIMDSRLLENPSGSCQPWEGPLWGPSFEVNR